MKELIAESKMKIDSKKITNEKFVNCIEILKDECKKKAFNKDVDISKIDEELLPEIKWEEIEDGLQFIFRLYEISN